MAWGRFAPIKWSPIELDYLQKHMDKEPITQLAGWLGKSNNAIKNKIYEFKHGYPPGKNKKRKGSPSNIGKRKDLKLFLRSGWEANCLRWFKHEGKVVEYEPQVFIFPGIKHGTVSYTPDFRLSIEDKWIEVKGQLLAKDKVRIRRFKKFHPEEFKKLVAIVGTPTSKAAEFFNEMNVPILAYYNELNKTYKDIIKHWE